MLTLGGLKHTGENLKLVCAEFSTISLAVLMMCMFLQGILKGEVSLYY